MMSNAKKPAKTPEEMQAALQKLIASISRYGYSLGEVKSAINTVSNRKSSIYD